MTIRNLAILTCDECGLYLESRTSSFELVIEKAESLGWLTYGTRAHYCPECWVSGNFIQGGYAPYDALGLADHFYSEAFFKYKAIRPLINTYPTMTNFRERSKQVNNILKRTTNKYGSNRWLPSQIEPSDLQEFLTIFTNSPHDDWRAFLRCGEPLEPDLLDPKVELVIDEVINQFMVEGDIEEANRIKDEIYKQLAEKHGREMKSNEKIFFPSMLSIEARINKKTSSD